MVMIFTHKYLAYLGLSVSFLHESYIILLMTSISTSFIQYVSCD